MAAIRPKANSLTPEAAEALLLAGQSPTVEDTEASDVVDDEPEIPSVDDVWALEDEDIWAPEESADFQDVGDAIDAEIIGETEPERETKPERAKPEKAKSGPPNLDEWHDFFSRIVLRAITDWYISLAFRGVDEELLTEREVARLKMKPAERDAITRPFAELANKSRFTRKHGRMIIATADSFDSVLALGLWFSRVNRIAKKYRPQRNPNVRTRQNAQANGNGTIPPENIRVYSPGSG